MFTSLLADLHPILIFVFVNAAALPFPSVPAVAVFVQPLCDSFLAEVFAAVAFFPVSFYLFSEDSFSLTPAVLFDDFPSPAGRLDLGEAHSCILQYFLQAFSVQTE